MTSNCTNVSRLRCFTWRMTMRSKLRCKCHPFSFLPNGQFWYWKWRFINRAAFLLLSCNDIGVNLQYKACHARILDAKRKFIEAALRYYEISHISQGENAVQLVSKEELEEALVAAIICTILASAGPQRSRVLAILYKDERCSKLPIYPILQKVCTK